MTSDLTSAQAAQDAADVSSHSPLFRDRSFWGMTATQFLGAFNDNLFKQLMLLLAIPIGAAAAKSEDQQWYAMMAFSLPFVLFSGYAGFLADRFSKRTVIVLSKVAEIFVMLLGLIGFLTYGLTGYGGLLLVLFLMGTQSAFFGPGKYGILPELFRDADLPRANGVILMTTFLAIIFGTASAGLLGVLLTERGIAADHPERLWVGSLACVAIAVIGTITSLFVRKTPPAEPRLRFVRSNLWVPPDTRQILAQDRPLLMALLVSCIFWMLGGIAMSAVNSLGKVQLGLNDALTSVLTAVIGLGICGGAIAAGRLSRGAADFRLTRIAAWGMLACLAALSLWLPGGRHLLGFGGSLLMLVLLGFFAGMFAIPVQVFIQIRPPEKQKGRMIAVMNIFNFIAIFLAGPIYKLFDLIVNAAELPRSPIFALAALLILPVALFYRPRSEELSPNV